MSKKERIRQLEAAVDDALDIIVWMSGSPTFGPEGEGHEHWVRIRDHGQLHRVWAARPIAKVAG